MCMTLVAGAQGLRQLDCAAPFGAGDEALAGTMSGLSSRLQLCTREFKLHNDDSQIDSARRCNGYIAMPVIMLK